MKIVIENYRLQLKLSHFKIYCELKDLKLSRIDGMKGVEVDKGILMLNCEKIMKEILQHMIELKVEDQTIQYYKKSPFKRCLKGIIVFIVMSLLQIFQVQIGEFRLNLCQNLNENDTEFLTEKQKQVETNMASSFIKKDLYYNKKVPYFQQFFSMLKFRSQIGLSFKQNYFFFKINKQENLSIRISVKEAQLKLLNHKANQLEKAFQITNTQLQMDAPFGYSLTYCFVNSTINLKVEEISGDYNCHMVPTYRNIKYFDYLQARILRSVRNKILKVKRKETPYLPKKIKVKVLKTLINIIDMQDFQDSDGLVGEKVSSLTADLDNLEVQILYNIQDDIIEQQIDIEIDDLDLKAKFHLLEEIDLLRIDNVSLLMMKHYNLIDSQMLDNSLEIISKDCIVNVHPVFIPLYNFYNNLVLRSYLEYDYDIYAPLIIQYQRSRKITDPFDKSLLFEIVSSSKKDIRQYIINPHDILKITLDNFEFYGIVQNNPVQKFCLDAQKFNFVYETTKDEFSDNIRGFQEFSFDAIILSFQDDDLLDQLHKKQANEIENDIINFDHQFSDKLSDNLDINNNSSNKNKFPQLNSKNVNLYFQTDSSASNLSPNKIQKKSQIQQEINSHNENILHEHLPDIDEAKISTIDIIKQESQQNNNNKKSFHYTDYEKEILNNSGKIQIGKLLQYKSISKEEDIITSDSFLDKLSINLNEHQMKCLIQYINKIDMDLYHDTRSATYTNPYTYQNNPYEKQCVSNTKYRQFEFNFTFGDEDSNKIKFFIEKYVQNSQGPNIMKMDTQQELNNIQMELQYKYFNQVKNVKIGKIDALSQQFYYKAINESFYELNGLSIYFEEQLQYLGDFFFVLHEKIQEIQTHAAEIAKKVLKKKKKFIEEKFSEQMVEQKIQINLKNFRFLMEDSQHNNFLKTYQAFIREYLSKAHTYNERNCMFNLQKLKQSNGKSNLLEIGIDNIGLQLSPLDKIKNFKDIVSFIKQTDQSNKHLHFDQEQFQAFRLIGLQTTLKNFYIKIRDYPFKIIEMENIVQQGQFILTNLKQNNQVNQVNRAHMQRLFYQLEVSVGAFETNVGLCLVSGLNEILNRFNVIFSQSQPKKNKNSNIQQKIQKNQKNIEKINNKIKKAEKDKEKEKEEDPDLKELRELQQKLKKKLKKQIQTHEKCNVLQFFDQWRMNFHGKVLIKKEQVSHFNLLTDIYPYSREGLRLTIGKCFIFYESENFKFNISTILFKRAGRPLEETHVLKIPQTTATIKFNWNCKGDSKDHFFVGEGFRNQCKNQMLEQFKSENLNIRFNVNFPKISDEEFLAENDGYIDEKQEQEKDFKKNYKKIVKNSQVIFFHYQQEFYEWIQQIPTLRHDILQLYQIRIKEINNQAENDEIISQQSEQENQNSDNENDDLFVNKAKIEDSETEEQTDFDFNKKNQEKKNEEEEDDDDVDEAQKSKYTDYVTIFKNSLNNSLNSSDKRGTFMRHINGIQVFTQMENIRLVVSNHDMHLPYFEKDEKIFKEELEKIQDKNLKEQKQFMNDLKLQRKIVGIQSVFDSLKFSSEFYLRKLTYVTLSDLKNKSLFENLDDQLEWGMKAGQGRLNFFYAGVFYRDGKLLPLNLPVFNINKNQETQESIQNFMEFFSIKDQELGKTKRLFNLDKELQNYQFNSYLNNISGMKRPNHLLYRFATSQTQKMMSQNSIKTPTKNIENIYNKSGYSPQIPHMNLNKAQSQRFPYLNKQKSENYTDQELHFCAEDIFFKTDSMVYVQNVKQALPNLSYLYDMQQNISHVDQSIFMKKKEYTSEHQMYKIKHFLMFGGSQLLVTQFISQLLNNIFTRQESNAEAVQKKMEKIARQKALAEKKIQQKQKIEQKTQKDTTTNSTNNNSSTTKTVQVKGPQKSGQQNSQGNLQTQPEEELAKDPIQLNNFGDKFKKKLFLKTPRTENEQELKELNVAINVQKPQFNLQYLQQESQLLVTSNDECYLIWKTNYLPFDKYKFDPQKQMILYFRSVEALAIPPHLDQKENVFWQNSKVFENVQEGDQKLANIIKAKEASFTMVKYNLTECDLDFSQSFEGSQITNSYDEGSIFGAINNNSSQKKQQTQQKENPQFCWGDQKRSRNLNLIVDSLNAEMTSYQFKTFQKTLEFLKVLVTSEESKLSYEEQVKKQNNEVKLNTAKKVTQHLVTQLPNYQKKLNVLQFSISYHLNQGKISMLDEKNMAFLELEIQELNSGTQYFKNNYVQFDLQVDSIQIYNTKEKDTDFYNVIHYNKTESSTNQRIIKIQKKQYNIQGLSKDTVWTIYDKYDVQLPPITIRLTEDIYDPFYAYFFSKTEKEIEKEKEKLNNQQKGSLKDSEIQEVVGFPFYYNNVLIKDLKFCIYLQSESSLKRLNGVSVIIDPYQIKQKFWLTQELFDDFFYYLKKQVASQAFSLIGQKLFGYSKAIDKKK